MVEFTPLKKLGDIEAESGQVWMVQYEWAYCC